MTKNGIYAFSSMNELWDNPNYHKLEPEVGLEAELKKVLMEAQVLRIEIEMLHSQERRLQSRIQVLQRILEERNQPHPLRLLREDEEKKESEGPAKRKM